MQLDDLQKDTLTEVANISFGNTSTALSVLLKEKVEVGVPTCSMETVETASDRIGKADEPITEVLLKMSGDLSGIMLVLFTPEEAKLLDNLLKKETSSQALPEVGSILAGNALKALSKFLKLNVSQSIPDIATDMRRALVVSSVFLLGEETDQVLMLGTKFSVPAVFLSINVYFLFDEAAAKRILGAL